MKWLKRLKNNNNSKKLDYLQNSCLSEEYKYSLFFANDIFKICDLQDVFYKSS